MSAIVQHSATEDPDLRHRSPTATMTLAPTSRVMNISLNQWLRSSHPPQQRKLSRPTPQIIARYHVGPVPPNSGSRSDLP